MTERITMKLLNADMLSLLQKYSATEQHF